MRTGSTRSRGPSPTVRRSGSKALTTAAEKYGAIYKDYRTLIAGLTAQA
ncbi:MAG: hypothetical protein QM775_09185 [Pirellulales bacterium]